MRNIKIFIFMIALSQARVLQAMHNQPNSLTKYDFSFTNEVDQEIGKGTCYVDTHQHIAHLAAMLPESDYQTMLSEFCGQIQNWGCTIAQVYIPTSNTQKGKTLEVSGFSKKLLGVSQSGIAYSCYQKNLAQSLHDEEPEQEYGEFSCMSSGQIIGKAMLFINRKEKIVTLYKLDAAVNNYRAVLSEFCNDAKSAACVAAKIYVKDDLHQERHAIEEHEFSRDTKDLTINGQRFVCYKKEIQ